MTHPTIITDYQLAVDQARANLECQHRSYYGRITLAPIVAPPGVEAHVIAVPHGQKAKAIVLDLVQPTLPSWRLGRR